MSFKKTEKVSILIVNWNGEEIIMECLTALKNISYPNYEVIIVDNNSTDESVSLIEKKFENIKVIKSKENLGFAGGNNKAAEYATGDYILLLNSDAIVTKDFLEPLISALKKKEVGIAQPLVLYKDNSLHKDGAINSAGTYFLNTGFLYYNGYGQESSVKKFRNESDIFTAYGACMLIKKEVYDKVGLFDSDFFMYFEETDFCMRALLAGWTIRYVPSSTIFHKGGVSARKYGDAKIYFHSFKNRLSTYIKNFEIVTLIRIFPLHLLLCKLIAIVYLFTGRFTYFLAIEKAIIWNIIHVRQTLKKRRKIQQLFRTVSDKSYLPSVTKNPKLTYYLYLLTGLQYYKD